MEKETIELMEKMIEDGNLSQEIAEKYCPELKESKDEMVRKELLQWLKEKKTMPNIGFSDEKMTNWIAWLEKQGENNLIEEIKRRKELLLREKEKAVSSKDTLSLGGRIAMLEELLAFTKEKQGEQNPNPCDGCINCKGCINCEKGELREVEQKPADVEEVNFFDDFRKTDSEVEQNSADKYKEWYDFIRWFVEQRTDNYTLIPSDDDIHKWGNNILNHARKVLEQNPSWSEEDEGMIEDIIFELEENQENISGVGYKIDWLKSLKDRVLPQPNQSKSGEDKKHIETISLILEDKKKEQTQWGAGVLDEEITWLKSLHPQNHWKPTEEQMEALNSLLLKGEITEIWQAPCLQSLYYNLKAL